MKEKELFLASTTKRILARVFDILFFLFFVTISFFFIRFFFLKDVFWQILLTNIISILIFLVYFVFGPYFFSYQTLSKKIFGISLFFPPKNKSRFFPLLFREIFIIVLPLVLTWILYFLYFLIIKILNRDFNSIYFLGRSSIVFFLWWFFYFVFIRINPKKQIFIDRWFSVFVVDNRIKFFFASKKTDNKNISLKKNLISKNLPDISGLFVSLNKEQKNVVSFSQEMNLRILAGPGTGKTTVLTERIAFLIKKANFIPERILTLTFTKKACQNIKSKIMKALNLSENVHLPVFTYHAFCYLVLVIEKKHLNMKNIMILDQKDQVKLINNLLIQDNESNQKVDSQLSKEMIKIIKKLQENWPKDYKDFLNLTKTQDLFDDLESEKLKVIWNFWLKYNEYKQKEGLMDFNDLLIKTYQIFESNPSVLIKWVKKYDYLAIDEFQDTNKLQFKIVQILTNSGKNLKLTVVGDPDQTIYGWRGAEMDFILNFNKYFEKVRTHTLVLNYRSTKKIIDLANSLIFKNKNRFPKKLFTNNAKGEDNVLFVGENVFDQADFIVDQIKKLSTKKVPLSQVAIVYRVNSLSGILEKSLLKSRISYRIFKGLEFFRRKEIKEFLTLLSILNSPKNIYIKTVLSWIKGIGEKTILRIEDLATTNQQTIFTYLSNNKPSLLSRFQQDVDFVWSVLSSFLKDLENLKSLKVVARKLFEDIYDEVLSNNIDYEERLSNINVLIDEIIFDFEKNHFHLSINEKINEFLFQTHLSIDTAFSDREKRESVNLMTIHSTKGLEFPYVFIFDVSNTNFPKITRSKINLEEERRLFFVAITRAKNRVFITTHRDFESIFIEEIQNSKNIDILN